MPDGNLDQVEVAMIYREHLSTKRQKLDGEMQLRGHTGPSWDLSTVHRWVKKQL